jgi:hypothetical protein
MSAIATKARPACGVLPALIGFVQAGASPP